MVNVTSNVPSSPAPSPRTITGRVDIAPQAFVVPMAQTIVGCMADGRPNFMAVAWLTRVNYQPPMLGVAINRRNFSHGAIAASGQFSVNFPTVDMTAVTDYTGLASGARVDKSGLFEVFHGHLDAAPLIRECPLCIECRVHTAVELPSNTFFIGEIVGAWCAEDCVDGDGAPDPRLLRPMLLTMPDNRYWSMGDVVGRAWHDGKSLRQKAARE
ncbi:MAG: flavin reductase family protein [Desulfovibrio sp.]|jgi:flavin reductase (DIM6/NTAB) family NADH-FMN oxidoreductase RutF|nr:flavin reductase family protein [Desulfovibrio sp.]